jgi:hypothetical protein
MSDRRFHRTRRIVLSALAVLGSAGAAAAQPFEFAYGLPATADEGKRGVTQVHLCPGGGTLSVGTSLSPAAPLASRVYAVRTTPAGGPFWERLYDVLPGGTGDTGESLVELRDGTGFVIAGSTRSAAALRNAFLMKIDCNGNVNWVQIYHSPNDESALDVIQARSGDPAFGTQPGDLIVAGFSTVPGLGQSALLFRTRVNGALLWNRRYDISARAAFQGLAEARPTAGTSTGDVVAAGFIVNSALGERGYAARVSGNNGLFLGAPHCAAAYPGVGRARFEAVVHQSVAAAGSLVFAGSTQAVGASSDVFLVRTTPNPCAPMVQQRIGDNAATALVTEQGFDLQEVQTTLGIAPLGALALTGSVNRPPVAGSEAFLLVVNPLSLQPLAGTGRRYGNFLGGFESGHSLALLPNGFLIAGATTTDFSGGADPRDLYLVQADTNGKTNCAAGWNPPALAGGPPPALLAPQPIPFLQQVPGTWAIGGALTPINACP